MADKPLIDLWKWLGYEDKEKDRESARRVNESTETYKKQREIDTTAALARDKASYETKRQRFLDAHINANRDNPDAVGLAESANRDWAKAVASESMPGVENYITSTARQPGLAKNAQETQRAETGKATVLANKAEGQAELASKAGEEAIKSEIATSAATTATKTNDVAKATAKTPFMANIGAGEGEAEQDEIFNRKKNMEETDRIRQRLSPDAPYVAEKMRAAALANAENQAKQGSSTAGLAQIQYDIGAGTKDKLMDTTAAELAGRTAVANQLVRSPEMKFPGYDPLTQMMMQRMGLGGQPQYNLNGQPMNDTTAIRPPMRPNPTPQAGIQWR